MANQIPTLDQSVTQIKAEVLADIAAGTVPGTVGTFADLHDFVDANCYGGFCDDAQHEAMIDHFGGRDDDEGMPAAMVAHLNAAQNAIDAWLRAGRPELVAA